MSAAEATRSGSKDLFLSHASEDEDKADVVLPLAEKLVERGLTLWLDRTELKLGDSLRRTIEAGLSKSRFGVTVLSKSFFAKQWPQQELDGLFALEGSGEKRILPVWHGIDADYIRAKSPLLADRLGISTTEGLDRVADEIVRAIK